MVPPKEACSDKVRNHHIHSVVVVCQKDAENPHSAQRPAKPVIPPEPLGRICQSNRRAQIKPNSTNSFNRNICQFGFFPLDVTALSSRFASTDMVWKHCFTTWLSTGKEPLTQSFHETSNNVGHFTKLLNCYNFWALCLVVNKMHRIAEMSGEELKTWLWKRTMS